MAYPYQEHIWVSKEVIRRDYLQNIEDGIYDEQQERLRSEGVINDDITTESNRAKNAEQTLTNNLSAEVTRAQGAEASITSDLAGEVTRAKAKENDIDTSINDLDARVTGEATRATNAEDALSTSISDEATRATAAESNLSTLITNEGTRATNAESALSTQITNEISRATQAENELRSTMTRAYKASGSVYFADLPALDESRQGNVYDIKDAFVTTYDFVEGPGKDYPAGTNVAIVSHESEEYHPVVPQSGDDPSAEGWYEYDGSTYTLSSDTTVDASKTYYEYVEYEYKYDVVPGFVDLSNYVEKTDKATTSQLGLVKPDGTTITIDSNGVISSIGGGQGSAEAAERMIAPIEADASASTNAYAVGERLILNEILYKAKTAIAVGDALVVDTNIELANAIADFDTTPTQGSTKFVTSGGVYSYIDSMITQALSASY